MNNQIKTIILTVGMMFPSTLFANYSPKSGEIGLRGGLMIFEGDSNLDTAGVAGISFGHYLSRPLEFEFCMLGGQSENSQLNQDVNIFFPTVEALYHFGESAFRPFLAAGAGMLNLNYKGSNQDRLDFTIPMGGGVKWYFYPNFIARADARYLFDTESGVGTNNALVTIGISVLFGEDLTAPEPRTVAYKMPAEPPPPVDSDGDGVEDVNDACPGTQAGTPVNEQGCPRDSDSDGVPDFRDTCPNTTAGIAVDANGCPPTAKVLVVPEKDWVLEGIQFEKMSQKLTASSKDTLDEAAEILLAHPNVRIQIQGHTDSYGKPALNLNLSSQRAEVVRKYLVNKGVSAERLSAKGYGEAYPKYDNRTPEGRAKNRRIEFKVLSR